MLTVSAPAPLAAPHPATARAAAVPLEVQRAVEQFLYRQAELLDGKAWQDYIDLFATAGV